MTYFLVCLRYTSFHTLVTEACRPALVVSEHGSVSKHAVASNSCSRQTLESPYNRLEHFSISMSGGSQVARSMDESCTKSEGGRRKCPDTNA